jgi:hypothetical protein
MLQPSVKEFNTIIADVGIPRTDSWRLVQRGTIVLRQHVGVEVALKPVCLIAILQTIVLATKHTLWTVRFTIIQVSVDRAPSVIIAT